MSRPDATERFPGGWADVFTLFGDEIAEVLDEGSMDETTRANLASLYRRLSLAAATWTDQREVNPTPEDEERRWMHTWWNHVGAYPYLFGIGGLMCNAIYDARLPWLDELDAMSDRDLLRIKGIGRRYAAQIRQGLEVYYWRADESASRELWTTMAARLRRDLEYPYLPDIERTRLLDGIALADSLLAGTGQPLDPSVPRLIA